MLAEINNLTLTNDLPDISLEELKKKLNQK